MRSIEMDDVSLADIAVRTSRRRPPISLIAYVISRMLQSVGAKASEEQVYEDLINGDEKEVSALVGAVMTAFTPQTPEGKNHDARPGKQPQARATKKAAR
jgi:hypothetical protein